MRRIWLSLLLVLISVGTTARAQYITAGSTPQGDYLRGLGIAAWGMGTYNLNTAQANSINTDTAIRLDMYFASILRESRDNWNKLDKAREARYKADYEKIKSRIRDHPESVDVFTGNALNAALDELNDPRVQPSSFRLAPVPIPREILRQIPFKLDEKGVIFSLQRLTGRGRGKWPVAFQQPQYIPERRAFEKAIDKAMDQMIEGKLLTETIAAYEQAVQDLSNKLQRDYYGKTTDKVYTEAKTRLNEMLKATDMLKTTKMQSVMADLDKYAGKTVDDLCKFMLVHNLRFASADSSDERDVFVKVYAALDQVRVVVLNKAEGRADDPR